MRFLGSMQPGTVGSDWFSWLLRCLVFGVAPLVLSFSASLAATAYVQARGGSAAATGGSAGQVTTAQLMNLAPLQPRPAPGFTLTDQNGKQVTLASFRGKAVLLGFFDPRGTQVSPLVARMLLQAQRDLGPAAGRVAFVGVNVNPAAASVADVRRFTASHGLARLPDWYFLTGPVARLAAVWRAYGINVQSAPGSAQTVHSDYLYFLDPLGTERFMAEPVAGQRNGAGYLPDGTIARWAQGIARYLKASGRS